MELGFACGVLPRLRGRDLVDDCQGDLLLSSDSPGTQTRASAAKTGTGIDDEELRHLLGGSGECRRITIDGFDPKVEAAWKAATKHMGSRLLFTFSRDGMIQP